MNITDKMKFRKELYPKVALLKAAYNYTDKAFIHLDADAEYYYVYFEMKDNLPNIKEKEFVNEMLAQSVRHEIYLKTKNIRELLYARAMATSVVYDTDENDLPSEDNLPQFEVNEILQDWFSSDEDS